MFDFGENWEIFSRKLNESRIHQATENLEELLVPLSLKDKSFLDIGCGSGLASLAALRLGASPVVGIDLNPKCVFVSQANIKAYNRESSAVSFQLTSALDKAELDKLGVFDVVYSWGVLHHTGDMYRAIELACRRVRVGGYLALAIYNRHVTSRAWWHIKRTYNRLPAKLKSPVIYLMSGVIAMAKLVVTRKNPFVKDRGMEFMVDVVDWVGGFPYEYATVGEIEFFLEKHGFNLIKTTPSETPTGCNQMVFVRED